MMNGCVIVAELPRWMSSEEQTKMMRNLACMLHSAYFSTLKNSKKDAGLFGSLDNLVKGI